MVRLVTTLWALLRPEWLARRAFPKSDLEALEAAVAAAESGHRGEIRVVVALAPEMADVFHGRPVRARAEDAFARLRVWDTEENSGVLIYLAWTEHEVEIVADRGIAAHVPAAAWEGICGEIVADCRAGHPAQALAKAVASIGELLRTHFPLGDPEEADNPDELPNLPRLE